MDAYSRVGRLFKRALIEHVCFWGGRLFEGGAYSSGALNRSIYYSYKTLRTFFSRFFLPTVLNISKNN